VAGERGGSDPFSGHTRDTLDNSFYRRDQAEGLGDHGTFWFSKPQAWVS
jgi:hypothetical protein